MENVAESSVSDNRRSWKEKRLDWVGSSDIATIVGLNKWQSPLELWAIKTKKVPQPDSNNPYFIWGRLVEPAIRELFHLKHLEYKLAPNDTTYYHDKERWAVATPDNWLLLTEDFVDQNYFEKYDHSGSDSGILEMKTSSRFNGWEEGCPDYAHVQTMWQMGICHKDWARVAGVLAGRPDDLRTPFFRFDKALFDVLLNKAGEFINCVRKDIPPNAGPRDAQLLTNLIAKHDKKDAIDLKTSEVGDWVAQYDEAYKMKTESKKELEYWDDRAKEAENNIRKALGDSSCGMLEDGRMVTLSKVEKKPYTVTPKPYFTFKIK